METKGNKFNIGDKVSFFRNVKLNLISTGTIESVYEGIYQGLKCLFYTIRKNDGQTCEVAEIHIKPKNGIKEY